MSRQANYLAGLLDGGEEAPSAAPRADRGRGTTLLGRESALARVASGEVRQVTQLLLEPARVRVWAGNARSQQHLTEASVRDLIDSMIAEGGQKVPAVVRRIEGEAAHDYEVIAGTRRLFAVKWLRVNSYPDMMFVAQVATLDDEAAFRLADLENRARKDVSDIERARNYAAAFEGHYGGQLGRMAERLRLSKGWLSKMLRVATLPDAVVAAFGAPGDLSLTAAYPLAQALDEPGRGQALLDEAALLAADQAERRAAGRDPLPAAVVTRRLLAARAERSAAPGAPSVEGLEWRSRYGRVMLSVKAIDRQGVTIRVHRGSGGWTRICTPRWTSCWGSCAWSVASAEYESLY